MEVEIKASVTPGVLDGFLRRRWLECCGHLSEFSIAGTADMVGLDDELVGFPFYGRPERTMRVKLGGVLRPGPRVGHTYDFGPPTELKLLVVDEREGRIGRESLRLLSANEAPEWGCCCRWSIRPGWACAATPALSRRPPRGQAERGL